MESVARLLAANETVCFTPQNISEFWNVVTRPVAHNGLGFSVSLVAGEVEKIERILTLLRDSRHLCGMEALGHQAQRARREGVMTRGSSPP